MKIYIIELGIDYSSPEYWSGKDFGDLDSCLVYTTEKAATKSLARIVASGRYRGENTTIIELGVNI